MSSESIGVPRKGRNARDALERELSEKPEEVLDLLNGEGKQAAKTGENLDRIRNKVNRFDGLEMDFTGRDYQRPVIDDLEKEGKRFKGYQNNPFDLQTDRLYAGYDRILDRRIKQSELVDLDKGFEAAVQRLTSTVPWSLENSIGNTVKWAVMGTEVDEWSSMKDGSDLPETVLVPDELPNLGGYLAEMAYGENVETESFSSYAAKNGFSEAEEERILAESPDEVLGVYMFVSGDTAFNDYGLEAQTVPGAVSRIGEFSSTEVENPYKNSEESN